MKANYHTHTWRCRHAVGTERQYVENALKAGLEILGFADHAPYIFPDGYYSTFRMRLDQLSDYVDTVLRLREEYGGEIRIPLGLEIEYYPKHLPELLPILRDYPMDYLILGQHFVNNEYDAPYNGVGSRDEELLRQYVRQTCDAMNTGLFTYFAHPDLIHFQGSERLYRQHMRDICREAKSCSVPLEFNLLGLSDKKHYPNPIFWEMVAEEGCEVILGRDAHAPEALLDEKTEKKAMEILFELAIKPMEKTVLRKI
ncbi:MAG: histidinol-phosphatase [Oscillospiraceae bacterium]|nr:histidinol-phosphatase [Oscillospiraceae bacterium]